MDIATLLNEHSIDLASYSEVSIESGRAPITLSIWEAEQDTAPTVVFVPGTDISVANRLDRKLTG